MAGFAAGQRLLIDTGAGAEVRTVSGCRNARRRPRGCSAPRPPATRTSRSPASPASPSGAEIDIDPGPNQDHVTITEVGTAGTNSTVAAAERHLRAGRPVADRRELDLERRRREHQHPGRDRSTCARPSPSPTPRRSPAPSCGSTPTTGTRPTSTASRCRAPPGANNAWQTSQISDIKSLLVAGHERHRDRAVQRRQRRQPHRRRASSTGPASSPTRSWKALPGTPASPPAGWNTAGFDDSSWPAANVTGAYGIAPWNLNVQRAARADHAAGGQRRGLRRRRHDLDRHRRQPGDQDHPDRRHRRRQRLRAHADHAAVQSSTPSAHRCSTSPDRGPGSPSRPPWPTPTTRSTTLASPGTGITFSPGARRRAPVRNRDPRRRQRHHLLAGADQRPRRRGDRRQRRHRDLVQPGADRRPRRRHDRDRDRHLRQRQRRPDQPRGHHPADLHRRPSRRIPVRGHRTHHTRHGHADRRRPELQGLPRHRGQVRGLVPLQRRPAQPDVVRRRLHRADGHGARSASRPASPCRSSSTAPNATGRSGPATS